MSLLKLLQEQTVENHDKPSIREVDEPHHYARGASTSGTCFRRPSRTGCASTTRTWINHG